MTFKYFDMHAQINIPKFTGLKVTQIRSFFCIMLAIFLTYYDSETVNEEL